MFEPELGQMAFGKPWEQYEVPRQIGDMLCELADMLLDNIYDSPSDGVEYCNDVFEMHKFWWGDCTCGFDDEEWEWLERHPHKPDCFHVKYEKYEKELEEKGITLYNHKTKEKWKQLMKKFAEENGYPRLEGIAVYCDCGRDEEYEKWLQTHGHKPDCKLVVPNFLYKPTGLAIYWYKWIGRSMSANQKIRPREFRKIIDHCIQSAQEDINRATEAKRRQKQERKRWIKDRNSKGYICHHCFHFLGETKEGKVECMGFASEKEVKAESVNVVEVIPSIREYVRQCEKYEFAPWRV